MDLHDFILTEADTDIINGQPATAVRYFETEALAINGDPLDALTQSLHQHYSTIHKPYTLELKILFLVVTILPH